MGSSLSPAVARGEVTSGGEGIANSGLICGAEVDIISYRDGCVSSTLRRIIPRLPEVQGINKINLTLISIESDKGVRDYPF